MSKDISDFCHGKMSRQKMELIEKRDRMTEDVRADFFLPPATQQERLRLFELISVHISWIEQTEALIAHTIRVLDSPPRRIREHHNLLGLAPSSTRAEGE